MKKVNLPFLLFLFLTSQAFAQQSQSFAEHWFGVKSQSSVQKHTKTTPKKISAKAGLRSATATSGVTTLDLSQPTNPASFSLNAKNVWTETYNAEDYPFIEFNNSTFLISHNVGGEDWAMSGYWDGFTYSKNADNTDYGAPGSSGDWVSNQWGNMAAGGIKTDAEGNVLKDGNGVVLTDPNVPYLLGYCGFMDGYYDYPALSVYFNDVYQADGVYVNNSPWPYYGNIAGDGFAQGLTNDGDYFKLIIHGIGEDYEDNGKSVEYYLARNAGGVLIQSPNWEWIDLSALGEIGGIYFRMESTDSGPYGINTATYFCLDKLQVHKSDESKINEVKTNTDVYPNPFADYIIVNTTTDGIATIYNLSGNAILSVNLKNGYNHIETSALPKGVYMLKYNDNAVKIVK